MYICICTPINPIKKYILMYQQFWYHMNVRGFVSIVDPQRRGWWSGPDAGRREHGGRRSQCRGRGHAQSRGTTHTHRGGRTRLAHS